jgi:type II secretory ATPase GspE/PulE/Tfp pilus assembly ATPase PilB-like protein
MAAIYLSPVFCAANMAVITESGETRTVVGMLNPDDQILKARIKKSYPDHEFVFSPISREAFNLKLSQLYSEDTASVVHTGSQADDVRKSAIDHVAIDAPVINLLNSLFLEAVSKKASDIHIESYIEASLVRFRIDGILIPVRTIPEERAAAISARLKLLANLNVLENRRPQDGHIDIISADNSFDVRISITPTIWGESIVLRLLNQSDTPLSVETLGFSEMHQKQLHEIMALASGLVLVTGPTGSGKTTTLAALLKALNRDETKIISIEDPVEYRIKGITQIQINEALGLTFDAVLRRIFRQDPDIIMVGEIRDIETAELAVRASLTGHLVFATLHTNDAAEAVYRLQNMGIPLYLLSAVLKAVIAQRLVRKICGACHAAGCEHCSGTGYQGRTLIAEILWFTPNLSAQIQDNISLVDFHSRLKKLCHQYLIDDGTHKVSAGITTEKELYRELGRRYEA